jgi:hypothetical protein
MNEQKRSYPEAVELTVNWWCEKSFNTPNNFDNGDAMCNAFGNWAASLAIKKVDADMITKFKNKLSELLLKLEGKGRSFNRLDVDYHPCGTLSEACMFSGIDTCCLPCKTFTQIEDNNEVRGRYQYGGAWFSI